MIDIYGTIGPSCSKMPILREMFQAGMTGMRVNLSHMSLAEAIPEIRMIQEAAGEKGIRPEILIDLQGPELRIGHLSAPLFLREGEKVTFVSDPEEGESPLGTGEIPVAGHIFQALTEGTEILLDDGKLLLSVTDKSKENRAETLILRGGPLTGRKSIAVSGKNIPMPALTGQDRENIRMAPACGVTGVMQPFVRSADDLREVREALNEAGGGNIRLFAKIENMSGVSHLDSFFGIADEIVIARGDLGNALPLWKLPGLQKQIEHACLENNVPFMVVTQMLASMEEAKVPTRAEVSDIFNAAADGAASVMVTGETAVGKHPAEVIHYLARTAAEGEAYRLRHRGEYL